MTEDVGKFLNILIRSQRTVFLTGAGISTDSGIPDYRSPETGLWNKIDQSVVSLEGFLKNPENYYSYALELYPIRSAAKPNSAHRMLATLEKDRVVGGVITQNVDGLHQDAGSEKVCELHGSTKRVICLDCKTPFPMDKIMKRVLGGENPPLCDCGGVLKPDAVFFGEPLRERVWNKAINLINGAGLLVVVGTSLQVFPVSSLPSLALKNSTQIVIINLGKTPFDKDATLIINRNIGDFFLNLNEKYKKLKKGGKN